MYQVTQIRTSNAASVHERNLLLVHQPGAQDLKDFEEIAALVRQKAPDIEVFIASNAASSAVTRRQASRRPTLVFTPLYLRYFKPSRGKVYSGQLLTKQQQMERFRAAGLPVPYYWHKGSAVAPDASALGDYVLIKPATLGASQGRGIKLMRTEKALQAVGELGDVFIQRFIDTGPYASHYRVFTIFGRAVFSYKNTSETARGSLDLPDGELAKSVVRAHRRTGQTKTLCYEDDVLALARAAWGAIPEVPFHACDVVREKRTGALYLLEINPGGNTWIFSRENTPKVIAELGGYDLKRQFNAFETIADALIERTRLEAE
jgi:hypothetical protein